MISIDIRPDEALPGERVRATVTWSGDGQTHPRALRVGAGWRTEGRGDVDSAAVHESRHDPGALPALSVSVEFEVPREGPLSYDGRLIRIIWEVWGQADLPMRSDEYEARAFRVVPARDTT